MPSLFRILFMLLPLFQGPVALSPAPDASPSFSRPSGCPPCRHIHPRRPVACRLETPLDPRPVPARSRQNHPTLTCVMARTAHGDASGDGPVPPALTGEIGHERPAAPLPPVRSRALGLAGPHPSSRHSRSRRLAAAARGRPRRDPLQCAEVPDPIRRRRARRPASPSQAPARPARCGPSRPPSATRT
jgi:hypothetical protein